MLILYLALVAATCFLSLLPVVQDHKKLSNVAFAVAAFSLSMWALSCYWLWNSSDMLFWVRMAFVGPSFLPAALLVFVTQYPKKIIIMNPARIIGLSCIATFFAAMSVTDFIVLDMKSMTDVTFNIGHKLFSIYFLVTMGAVFTVVIKGLNTYSTENREKIGLFALGLILTVSLGTVLNLILPLMGITHYTHFGPLSVFFFISFSWFAMLKHELLDIKLVISRLSAYMIVFSLILISYVALFTLTSEHIYLASISIALALFWVGVSSHLINYLVTTVTRKFVRGWYNFDEVVQSFFEHLTPVFDWDSLEKGISLGLKTIEVDDAKLFHNSSDQRALFDLFQNETDILRRKDISKGSLKTLDKTCAFEGQVFMAIYSAEGAMRGVVAIGAKASGAFYSAVDMRLFSTVSHQVRLVLDRIDAYERLKTLNLELEDRVQEQVKEIEKSKVFAEKASEQASFANLTMGIAHEIRNPVSNMRARCEDIFEDIDDKDAILEFSEMMVRNLDRLVNITEKMLEYGAVSSSETKEVSVNELIEHIFYFLQSKASELGIEVKTDLQDIPDVLGDPTTLYRVLINIMLNALEATEKGGLVLVSTETAQFRSNTNELVDGIKVSVKDTGCGIAPEDRDKIFNSFFSKKYGHTGIGLSYSLQIIDQHNGIISIPNQEEKGTTFEIYVPLQPA